MKKATKNTKSVTARCFHCEHEVSVKEAKSVGTYEKYTTVAGDVMHFFYDGCRGWN